MTFDPHPGHINLLYSKHMKQLDPKAVWFFFVSFILRWLVVLIILSIWSMVFLARLKTGVSAGSFVLGAPFFLLIFLGICFVWAKLTYHFYRYELREDGFRKESGVIYKKYVTIPYERIQNVDIYRGILARLLGLSDLQIQTAGASAVVSRYGTSGAGAEGRLPAVSKEIAEELRDELVRRARGSRNQGL